LHLASPRLLRRHGRSPCDADPPHHPTRRRSAPTLYTGSEAEGDAASPAPTMKRPWAVRREPERGRSSGVGRYIVVRGRSRFRRIVQPKSRNSSPLQACRCGLDDRSGMYRWDCGSSARRDGVRNLFVAQAAENLENFAPGWEHPSTLVLVLIHGEHELQFRLGVIALARCGVHESPPSTNLPGLGGAGRLLAGATIRPFRA